MKTWPAPPPCRPLCRMGRNPTHPAQRSGGEATTATQGVVGRRWRATDPSKSDNLPSRRAHFHPSWRPPGHRGLKSQWWASELEADDAELGSLVVVAGQGAAGADVVDV